MAEVRNDDLYTMLISSIHYAMGRQSYITSETCELVRRYAKHLTSDSLDTIADRVTERLEQARRLNQTLGSAGDQREFEHLVGWIRSLIQYRVDGGKVEGHTDG